MYGLDVFYDVVVSRERAQALSGSPAAELARKLIEKRSELYGDAGASIGDGGAVCAVIDPAGMTTQRFPLRVELAGSWSRGRTIVDTRDWTSDLNNDPHGQSTSIVDVVTTVDGGRYAELWLAAVEGA